MEGAIIGTEDEQEASRRFHDGILGPDILPDEILDRLKKRAEELDIDPELIVR